MYELDDDREILFDDAEDEYTVVPEFEPEDEPEMVSDRRVFEYYRDRDLYATGILDAIGANTLSSFSFGDFED